MASQFQVNLQMLAGCDFFQDFYLTNPDFSPMDLTGLTFHASMQKHANEKDVVSKNGDRVTTELETEMINATEGVYRMKIGRAASVNLEEGKYVYDVVMVDGDGNFSPANSGLIFVDTSFGYVEKEDDTPDPDDNPGPDPINPPGSGGDDGGEGSAP